MYTECTVLKNELYYNKYGKIRFAADEIVKKSKPGQFVMLKCWEGNVPFLLRPFSINNIDRKNGYLDILYKIVGKGTRLLSQLKAHDKAMILGPFGNGFVIPENAKRIGAVGRGIGAAPMLFLASEAIDRNIDVYALLSASKEDYLFDKEKYLEFGAKVYTTCDDISTKNSLVTDHLKEIIKEKEFDAVYVCGSKRLMREIKKLKDIYGFAAYVSLEEHMACGVGACKGCICTTHSDDGSTQYERVCKEGPVFPIERLVP